MSRKERLVVSILYLLACAACVSIVAKRYCDETYLAAERERVPEGHDVSFVRYGYVVVSVSQEAASEDKTYYIDLPKNYRPEFTKFAVLGAILSGAIFAITFGMFLKSSSHTQNGNLTRTASLKYALFSFKGRLCRRDYWLKGAIALAPIGIINNVLRFGLSDSEFISRGIPILLSIVILWPSLALLIKRLHDHDRSGWFTATILIPIANIFVGLWIIVHVWFQRGSIGSNRFGEDPVQSSPASTSEQWIAERPTATHGGNG